MCRKYPGPRCSGATIKFMTAAKARLDAAIANDASEEVIARRTAAYNAHVIKYQNTPAYEESIRAEAAKSAKLAEASKSPTTKKGWMNVEDACKARADAVRNARLASRESARSEVIGKWKTTTRNPDTGETRTHNHEMSVAQAASYYNAGISGNTNARNAKGNITTAENVRESAKSLSPKEKELVDKFKKDGFPIRERSNWDFSRSYHAGMEPNFHKAPASYAPQKLRIDGEKRDVHLVEGSSPTTTTIRLHDDNGLTHEAKVTLSTVQDDDGKFYTVARFNGASALYGNRASQDAMDASGAGSLLRTDAPHWERTIVLGSGTVKREETRRTQRFVRDFTREEGKETKAGRVSGKLGNVISKLGTTAINRKVRRNEPIMHSTLDLTSNYAQTSSTRRAA